MNYDFSKYRKRADDYAIVKSFWGNHPPQEEIDAKADYEKIDFYDLKKWIQKQISQTVFEVEQESKAYYKNKINRLNKRYLPRIVKLKVVEFENNITDRFYETNDLFKKSYFRFKENPRKLKVSLVNDIILIVENHILYYVDKLIYITDVKEIIENSLKFICVYEIIYSNENLGRDRELVELFKDSSEYSKLIKSLLVNQIVISKDENSFEFESNIEGLNKNKIACALAYKLHKGNYIDYNSDEELTNAICSFLNLNFSRQNLKYHFNTFDSVDNFKKIPELNYLHFI